jgi:hypothetical protein
VGEDLQAAFAGDADVLVGSIGGAGNSEDGIAAFEEAMSYGILKLDEDGIADASGAGGVAEREREPFTDDGEMAGAVYAERGLFEGVEVGGNFYGIVIGAGAVGAGDHDDEWWIGGRHEDAQWIGVRDAWWTSYGARKSKSTRRDCERCGRCAEWIA